MNIPKPLVLAVLIPFAAFSTWVTWVEGPLSYITLPWTHWTWTQEFLDLCIALTLVCVWMVGDARRRGARAWPFLVLTALIGSIAPLLYLALRPGSPAEAPAEPPVRDSA